MLLLLCPLSCWECSSNLGPRATDCLELGRSDGFSLGRPAFFDRLSSQEQYFQDTTSNTSTPLHAEASTAIASSWCQQSRPAEGDSDWRCRNSNLTNDPTIFCKILGRSSGAVGLRCVQSGPGLCVAFFCRWLPPPWRTWRVPRSSSSLRFAVAGRRWSFRSTFALICKDSGCVGIRRSPSGSVPQVRIVLAHWQSRRLPNKGIHASMTHNEASNLAPIDEPELFVYLAV